MSRDAMTELRDWLAVDRLRRATERADGRHWEVCLSEAAGPDVIQGEADLETAILAAIDAWAEADAKAARETAECDRVHAEQDAAAAFRATKALAMDALWKQREEAARQGRFYSQRRTPPRRM